jgi:hypothetical protein
MKFEQYVNATGVLTANFTKMPGANLCQESFTDSLAAAITAGLSAVGSAYAVNGIKVAISSSDVQSVHMDFCTRRLSPLRRLSGAVDVNTNISYQVILQGNEAETQATILSARLGAPSYRHAFTDTFTNSLTSSRNSSYGVSVNSLLVHNLALDIRHIEVALPTQAPPVATPTPTPVPAPILRVRTRAPKDDGVFGDDSGGLGMILGGTVLGLIGVALAVLVFLTYKQKMSRKQAD